MKFKRLLHYRRYHKNSILLFHKIIGITFLFLNVSYGFGQLTDTTKSNRKPQTTDNKQQTIPNYHSPKKAALFSTALPGLGQAYNKKYWKIPVIYVGAAGLAYSIQFNQTSYVKFRTAYKYRIDGDPKTIDDYVGKYTDETLNSAQTYYHRYRDLSVIAVTALYILNILDASVDAHMFTFDVSDDLTFNLHPAIMNTARANQYITGLSLAIKL